MYLVAGNSRPQQRHLPNGADQRGSAQVTSSRCRDVELGATQVTLQEHHPRQVAGNQRLGRFSRAHSNTKPQVTVLACLLIEVNEWISSSGDLNNHYAVDAF